LADTPRKGPKTEGCQEEKDFFEHGARKKGGWAHYGGMVFLLNLGESGKEEKRILCGREFLDG